MSRSNALTSALACILCVTPIALVGCGEGTVTRDKTSTAQAATPSTGTTGAQTSEAADDGAASVDTTASESSGPSESTNTISLEGADLIVEVTCSDEPPRLVLSGTGLALTIQGVGGGSTEFSDISGTVNGADVDYAATTLRVHEGPVNVISVSGDLVDTSGDHTTIDGVVNCGTGGTPSTTSGGGETTTETSSSNGAAPNSSSGDVPSGTGTVALDGTSFSVSAACSGSLIQLKAGDRDFELSIDENDGPSSALGRFDGDGISTNVTESLEITSEGTTFNFSGALESTSGSPHRIEGRVACG